MKILFLTLVNISSIRERGIYQDLLRKFSKERHDITIVTPVERRKKIRTNYQHKEGVSVLQVKSFNITKTNVVEKGIGTLALEHQFLSAIKKHLSDTKFDLILYSTPPITFVKVIEYIKKRDHAYAYLLLKDIFPQNAVDMGMLKKGGFIHRQFLKKEKRLYEISDTIGCMSQANVEFILKHNPEIKPDKVEVNPNSIEPVTSELSVKEKTGIRERYSVPIEKKVFVYGGNLGKPQGLDFLLETISSSKNTDIYFLIVGNGTEFSIIQNWFDKNKPNNAKLLQMLPKEDYDRLLTACDVGLIFLDKSFTIPNFPSRLLSYLEMQKPIITATDENTDIGDVVQDNGCGFKVIAGDIDRMNLAINRLANEDLSVYQMKCKELLMRDYLVDRTYNLIMSKVV